MYEEQKLRDSDYYNDSSSDDYYNDSSSDDYYNDSSSDDDNYYCSNAPIVTSEQEEWHIANTYLQGKPEGTKLKRTQLYAEKGYVLPRAFIVGPGKKILALQGSKEYLGSGTYAKVKRAVDQQGNAYAVKISKWGELDKKEIKITVDLNVGIGYVSRQHATKAQSFFVLKFLGTRLVEYQYGDDEQRLDVAFQCVNLVNRLHRGELSSSGRKYVHGDLNNENFLIDDKKVVHLIDFGFSFKVNDEPFGSKKHPLNLNIDHTFPTFAPEIRNSKNIFSFKSDGFALSFALKGALSSILNLSKELCSLIESLEDIDALKRPHLELLKIALLLEIHKNSDDELSKSLALHNCIMTNGQDAKNIFQLIKAESARKDFVLATNILSHSPDLNTGENWLELARNATIREAVAFYKAAPDLLPKQLTLKNNLLSLIKNTTLIQSLLILKEQGVEIDNYFEFVQLTSDSGIQASIILANKVSPALITPIVFKNLEYYTSQKILKALEEISNFFKPSEPTGDDALNQFLCQFFRERGKDSCKDCRAADEKYLLAFIALKKKGDANSAASYDPTFFGIKGREEEAQTEKNPNGHQNNLGQG